MLASEKQTCKKLVLWDPIVLGQPYLQSLQSMHHQMIYDNVDMAPYPSTQATKGQCLGYFLQDDFNQQLLELDISNCQSKAKSIQILSTWSDPALGDLRKQQAAFHNAIDFVTINEDQFWDNWSRLLLQSFPNMVMQSITDSIRGKAA